MIALSRLLWLIAFDVSVIGLALLCQAMFPILLQRTREQVVATPWRSLSIGVINVAFFGAISAALLSAGQGVAIIGAIIGTLLLCLIAVGLMAVAGLIGERLCPDSPESLRRLLAGVLTLTLASSVPVIGWFVVLPLAGLIGCGAAIGALVRRPSAASVSGVPPPPPCPPPAPPMLGGA